MNIISTTSSNVCQACTASCAQLHVEVWSCKGGHKAELPRQTRLDTSYAHHTTRIQSVPGSQLFLVL